jgi:predicted transcriptional regulator
MLDTLHHHELIMAHVVGVPLQANLNQRRHYGITRKGLEYLEAYQKIQHLITYLGTEAQRPTDLPMDFVD